MNKAVFNMEPFTCPSCIKKIESTLEKMDGVNDAKVLFNSGRVRVDFDGSKTSADALEDTIARLGYPVLSKKVS
ncbi:heavy-metal-associated domain-containing protein [Pollutimonas thiosulfatoxidans]|uniref:Heavy metal-binding protein n=1 Tax=Pollutimonas thiosulfatoxidans TaxID=2028345 RepID=A0A410GGD9_9BURK|nr:heavy metal-associated domain-containing protein [Pollutimonas thiosulfatoxidans]MBF6618175.1 heavy-metal-associated domain-containing protein [Candidimonas sp.]NYT45560.1 heavy-metal-associated domain-containing protein [Alcaligenaceae bacterium]QAA95348.1 heavy metal-binding protein [Pollutimonas thiosulfatoxidans]